MICKILDIKIQLNNTKRSFEIKILKYKLDQMWMKKQFTKSSLFEIMYLDTHTVLTYPKQVSGILCARCVIRMLIALQLYYFME